MTTTTNYPNGQSLVSTALSPSQISLFIQSITYAAIGLPVPPPSSFQPVQVDWQTSGQPASTLPSQDVCYISCVPYDDEYSKIRNQTFSGAGPVLETWVYSKGWRIAWVAYGPNSEDRLRAVKSAMFLDYFNDQFNLQNLFPIPDYQEVQRVPELIQAQWWERADFSINVLEQITETISDSQATSVEVKVYEGTGSTPVADFTIDA